MKNRFSQAAKLVRAIWTATGRVCRSFQTKNAILLATLTLGSLPLFFLLVEETVYRAEIRKPGADSIVADIDSAPPPQFALPPRNPQYTIDQMYPDGGPL